MGHAALFGPFPTLPCPPPSPVCWGRLGWGYPALNLVEGVSVKTNRPSSPLLESFAKPTSSPFSPMWEKAGMRGIKRLRKPLP